MAGKTGRKCDERTVKMKEAYCHLHFDLGKTPQQIAKEFGLDVGTVYNHLEEIAQKSGHTREELLEAPWRSGERTRYNGLLRGVEPLDVELIQKKFDEAEGSLKEVSDLLEEVTKE